MKFDFDEDINIDLTPLIDVIFMLLIFFIMTTTFSKPVIDVLLPASITAEKAEDKTKEIAVTVSNKGDIYYNDKVINVSELETVLKNNPDKILNMFIDKPAISFFFCHIYNMYKCLKWCSFIYKHRYSRKEIILWYLLKPKEYIQHIIIMKEKSCIKKAALFHY